MLIIRSRNGVPIRLTDERWSYILQRHPEMKDQESKVLEAVSEPDLVLAGDFGAKLAVRFYKKTPVTEKQLVVAYREVSTDDGFIITAYFASEIVKWREVLWKQ